MDAHIDVARALAREMPVDILAHPTLVTIPSASRRRRAVDRGARDANRRRAVRRRHRVRDLVALSAARAARAARRRARSANLARLGRPHRRSGRRHRRPLALARALGVADTDLYDPERHGSKTHEGRRCKHDPLPRALGGSHLVAADRATASWRSRAIGSHTSAQHRRGPAGRRRRPRRRRSCCRASSTRTAISSSRRCAAFSRISTSARWILRLTGARRAVLDRDALLDSARYGLEEGVRAGITYVRRHVRLGRRHAGDARGRRPRHDVSGGVRS